MRALVLSVLAASLMALPALAAGITVSDGWFRALPANLPSGGYFTLHNGGAETVTLTGAESPACGMLMLHKTDDMNGMSSMGDAANIPVASGDTLKFAPGGYHLMCMQPKMTVGTKVMVTLAFADGAKLTVPFAVKNAKGQ